jgi:hypothetical protein
MNLQNDDFLARYKWHIAIICVVSVVVALLLAFSDRFETSQTNFYTQILYLLGALVVLAALLTMLSRVIKILDAIKDNSIKLEELTNAFEQIHAGLAQINKSTRISDTVKSIAFKDADRQSLKEVVFEKLQAKDFNAAKDIIEEIEKHPEYKELAEELKEQADHYQNATEQERMNQIIAHIEKLIHDAQWTRASAQIEGLVKAHPESEQAKNMRIVLYERKQERKRILLAAWDDAVTNQETDRSLSILKELDSYLTPSEASALQEAASDIFRSKLHSLGMQFSMAVSEKRWNDALEIGQKIMKDFPNSKMCQEIYTKLDVLKQNVEMQNI